MAKQVKILCDRCKKDVTKDKWSAILRLPKKITLRAIYENGYSKHDFVFDLCEDCMDECLRILGGKKDGCN